MILLWYIKEYKYVHVCLEKNLEQGAHKDINSSDLWVLGK